MIIDNTNSASAVAQRGLNTASHIGGPAQNSGLKALRRDKADDDRGVAEDVHLGSEDDQQTQDMNRLRSMARGGDTAAPNGQTQSGETGQRPPDYRFGAWGPPGGSGSSSMADTVRGFMDRATDGIKRSFDRMSAALQTPSTQPQGGTNANFANPGWTPNAGAPPPNGGWAPPAAGWTQPWLQSPPMATQERPQVFGGPPNVGGPPPGPMMGPGPMMAPSPMMGMFPGAQMNKSTMMAMFMSMMPGGMALAMPFMFMSQFEQQKQTMQTIQGAMAAHGYGPAMGPTPMPPAWDPAAANGPGQASSVGQPWNPAPVSPALAAITENVHDFHNYLQTGTPIPARSYIDASNRLNDQVGYWMADHSNDPAMTAEDKAFATHVRSHVQGYLQTANEQLRASGVPNDEKEVHFTRFLADAITKDAGPNGPRFPGLWVAGQQLINAGLPRPEESFVAGGNMVGMGTAAATPASPPQPAAASQAAVSTPAPAPKAPAPPVTVSDGFAQNAGVIHSCREIRTEDGKTLQRIAQILPRGGDPSQMLTLTEDVAKGTLTVSRGDDVVSVTDNIRMKLPTAGSSRPQIELSDGKSRDRGPYESASQSIDADGGTHFFNEKFEEDRHEPYKYWDRDQHSIHASADGALSGTHYSRWQTGVTNSHREYDLEVKLEPDGTLNAGHGDKFKPFVPFGLLAGK